MPKLFGIPYMGSKTKIAVDILRRLPDGKRFVDLCGGGFAMSHAAVLSRKYDSIYYNDFNPLIVELIRNALAGKYNYTVFKPPFVTREEFYRLKDTNGYVKYIWSFGNTGKEYMFGKDVEPLKHKAHDFVVFGKWDDELDKILPNVRTKVKASGVHNRRMEFCGYARRLKHRFDLQQLQQLEQLERLERLEITCGSYEQYVHQDGDVVYCDPPYEGTGGYGTAFDYQQFYDWAASRPYQVFFSSYQITDNRFKIIWQTTKQSLMNSGSGQFTVTEFLYTNKTIKSNHNDPLSLFQSVLYG